VKGKRTYAAVAGVIVSVAIGVAARHGFDLAPFQADLVDALAIAFAAAAAYFRSVAHPAKEKPNA
jgi:hypothetical protein